MNSKNLFLSKMKLYGDTQKRLATVLGISLTSVNAKINGQSEWRQNEMIAIRDRYHLTDEEFNHIFLIKNVTVGEQ